MFTSIWRRTSASPRRMGNASSLPPRGLLLPRITANEIEADLFYGRDDTVHPGGTRPASSTASPR